MNADQIELVIPAHSTDDILRDRLSALVEEFNASTVPEARIHLHLEIQSLRRLLRVERKA